MQVVGKIRELRKEARLTCFSQASATINDVVKAVTPSPKPKIVKAAK